MSVPTAADEVEEIAAEVRACELCDLSKGRTHAVPGTGNPKADILLIGEGPGWHEDQQGHPFVGAAGKFLDDLLGMASLNRQDVFITNIVKCRPPGNRDPLPDEIAACTGYLFRQIKVIDPRVIVTLGRFSMGLWFPGERISRIHGQPRTFGDRMVVPMYHPAAALHQGSLRPVIEEDFRKLPRYVYEVEQQRKTGGGENATPAAEQMSLFD